ncbi:peptidoglycan DD-metalloendopeptidase family protein [Helicobacter sp. faydin-H20]|uniref:murein hydrolase activator EnvC family protein n=1 Tax=Helicobacter anatolicus TaxID=2905874 RepID=UPI001E5AF3BD|nr:peptidoglycan DD-metalloendopeptidase family protein [Helicobacter anatolicus]MCE3036567.1 peptidoglycan DD-metalloendopeptidase family protein [Helicobacter anatolicus]
MKKLLLFFPFLLLGANLQQINKDISANQKKIQKKENEKNQITNLLQKLGIQINEKYKKIQNIDLQITHLQRNINNNQDKNLNEEKSLVQYKNILKDLQDKKQEIRQKITKMLINDASFLIILNQNNPISPDDIILQEIFRLLNKQGQEKILLLSQQEAIINQKIKDTKQTIENLNNSIAAQTNKRDTLKLMLKEQKELIKTLKKDLAIYNKKLETINAERKSLDLILSNLNILKQKTQKEIEEEQKRQNALEAPLEVKQIASSYKTLSTATYKGPKTIAPLESFTIEQKFGPYFDPVYKLKVFNESVILVSKTPNAVVRNILDGKVVYAKEVPILKKVIIIENANGIHTIYSQLDKIAPTIKVGLKIQKGYIIGRVEQKLSFEVTQKDKHINPLEIFQK